MSDSTIEGIDELLAKLKELEEIPQKIVTSAARKGATMALNFALSILQPVNGSFLGRQGSNADWGQYSGGNLKSLLKLKIERTPKGKTIYKIDTTWYAHFRDLSFTTKNGKVIDGNHFLKYALTEHYEEIRDAIIDDLSKGIDKVVGNSGV